MIYKLKNPAFDDLLCLHYPAVKLPHTRFAQRYPTALIPENIINTISKAGYWNGEVGRGGKHYAAVSSGKKSSAVTAPLVWREIKTTISKPGNLSPLKIREIVEGETPISCANCAGFMSFSNRYVFKFITCVCHMASFLSIGKLPTGGGK